MDFSDLLYHHALAFEEAARFYYDEAELEKLHEALRGMSNGLGSGGKLVFVGCGKSYKIVCKTVAMLTSMGIPAHDLHPIEAMHGDLGYCGPADVLVFCSTSGETDEVIHLLRYMKAENSPWERNLRIAVTGNRQSTLAQSCHNTIMVPQSDRFKEQTLQAGLRAPTVSTTLMIAVLDCICIELSKQWFKNDLAARETFFNQRHPGGGIGKVTSSANLAQLVQPSQTTPDANNTPTFHTYVVKHVLTETEFLSILITYDYIQFNNKNGTPTLTPTCLLREEYKGAVRSGNLSEWYARYL